MRKENNCSYFWYTLRSHLRHTKLFANTHVDESRQTGNIRTLTQIQCQEGQDLFEEVPTIEKTGLPHEPDLKLLDDSSCGKDLNIKFLTQVGGEPIYNTAIVDENTIILSNNVKCQIFNNSLNTVSLSSKKVQPPTKNSNNNNKKHQLEFSHDKKTSLRKEQELSTQRDKNQTHLDIDLDILTTTDFNYLQQATEKVSRYEDLVPIEPSENLKKLKSIQKSFAKKCVATKSSPKYSKHNKPYSPIQNSEIDLIVDATKNRVSYCSSCSSSNSCNCDITGDNSNTLYEGFGIGVVVSSSYSHDHITGVCGTVSLSSVTNSPTSVLPSFGIKTNKNLYGQKRYGAEHPANFDDREENDHTESASDIFSDFDEICSEPSSLREDLSRTETENKILNNTLKNYSKFHEKLNKEIQKQRLPINSDLSTNSYRIENCFHRCKDQCHKSYIEHNIFVSCNNKSINYNTMNFDAAKKTDLQTDVLTRSGFGINNEGVEVQNCVGRTDVDQNEHNNLYGGTGGIPNIPETMNGTTICGATAGAGGNQQKASGGTTQKRAQRRGGKQQPDRPERALFCLSLKNPVRSFCIRIVDSKYLFPKPTKKKYTSTHLLIRCIGNLHSCSQIANRRFASASKP